MFYSRTVSQCYQDHVNSNSFMEIIILLDRIVNVELTKTLANLVTSVYVKW